MNIHDNWKVLSRNLMQVALSFGRTHRVFLSNTLTPIFQISNTLEKPSILESSQVTSSLPGSKENPDVLVQTEM